MDNRSCIGWILATTTLAQMFSGAVTIGKDDGGQSMEPVIIEGVPEGFEVVRLDDSFGIHSWPTINNNGDIVWSLSFPLDDISDVYQFRDGWIWSVTDDDLYNVAPTLGNSGRISWFRAAGSLGPYEVVTQDAFMETEIVAHSGSAIGRMATNDDDWLVWSDDLSGDAREVELCSYDGTFIGQVTDNGGSNQLPDTNIHQDVVYAHNQFSDGPVTIDTVLLSDGVATLLTPGLQEGGIPDINDLRQVVFADRSGGVVLWSNGRATIVDQTGGTPVINNRGTIAFSRPNGEIREVILLKDNVSYTLPSNQYSAAFMSINEHDELAWRGFDFEQGGISAIFVLRRIAPKGDFNHDCRIDFFDYAMFQRCFTGADAGPENGLLGTCTRADFNADGDVDLEDASQFFDVMNGPDGPILDCVP